MDLRMGAEELSCFLDRHFQHVADASIVVANRQGLLIKTFAGTTVAWHPTRRQKVHLQLDSALTGTDFATAALHIKREPAGVISPNPSFREVREHLPDFIKHLNVSRRNRARRLTDGRLIHFLYTGK